MAKVVKQTDLQVADRLRNLQRFRDSRQSEEAVKLLQPHLPGIRALRDVGVANLEAWKQVLSATIYRRCRVTENQRVLTAAKALQSGDTDGFGI